MKPMCSSIPEEKERRRPKRKASDTTLDTEEEDVYEKNAILEKAQPKNKASSICQPVAWYVGVFLCISY